MDSSLFTQGIPVQGPRHRESPVAPVAASIIATWPVGTFVENLVALEDGSFAVSVESLREVQHVTADGTTSVLATFTSSVTGLLVYQQHILVSCGTIGQADWQVHALAYDQKRIVSSWTVSDALLLNGSAFFTEDTILLADSFLGRIYALNTTTGAVSVWLEHELLTKASSEPMLPGVNGIKVFNDVLYFTNTDRAIVGRVQIASSGNPETVEVIAEELLGDDFAVAFDGSLYITNHIYNSLLKLDKQGNRTILAGPEEGMAGATSAVFGQGPGTEGALFVTTTGGILAPYEGIVKEAKLVRLEAGATGARLGWKGNQ